LTDDYEYDQYDDYPEDDDSQPRKKPVITAQLITLVAVLLTVAVILVQFVVLPIVGQGQDIRMMSTGNSISFGFDSHPSFHSNGSDFFHFVTRDSVRFINAAEQTSWSEMISLNRPVAVSGGNYVAVGEINGRLIYVFDHERLVYRVFFDNPVLFFSVNETGFLSTIVQYDTGPGVHVYNEHRTTLNPPLFRMMPLVSDLMQPIAVEVSNDGRYIAIAVLDYSAQVSTIVQFRVMNLWDAWGLDGGLFAEETFPGQILTGMSFVENDRLVVATNRQIRGFRLAETQPRLQESWRRELTNNISHLGFAGGYTAFISSDPIIGATDPDPAGVLRIVNAAGRETAQFNLGRRATHLTMGQNAAIAGADRTFHAISFSGSHLWDHISMFDTRQVIFLENTDSILVTGANRADSFVRRRIRQQDEYDILWEG